jgi:hypothetical protein
MVVVYWLRLGLESQGAGSIRGANHAFTAPRFQYLIARSGLRLRLRTGGGQIALAAALGEIFQRRVDHRDEH